MFQRHIARARSSVLVRNAAWLLAGQGLSFILQGVSFVVLARLLRTSDYGLLAGVVALVTIASQYASLGAGPLLMRHVSPDHSRFRLYWGNAIMSVFVVGGLIVAALWLLGPLLLSKESLPILIPVAIAECIFVQLTAASSYAFQTFEKMKLSATITLLNNLLRVAMLLTLWMTMGKASAVQFAMASMCISILVAVVAIAVVTHSYGTPTFSSSLFLKNSGEGFVFAVSGSTTSVYNDFDKVMLSHESMNVANAVYSMAYRVVNIASMPVQSLVGAAYPRFYQVGVNGVAAVLPMARTLLKRTLVLGVTASICMFVFAPLLPHLAGKSYVEAVQATRWLCLIPLFRCFNMSAGDALSGAGDQKYRLLCQAVAAGGNLLLNLYLIPRYSWHGAAYASLITDASLGCMHWIALFILARRPTSRITNTGVALPSQNEIIDEVL